MLPYFVVLALSFAAAELAVSSRMSLAAQRAIWAFIVIILVVFAGLRGTSVGADTTVYVNRFETLRTFQVYWDNLSSMELGVKALYFVSRTISDNPTTFLILASIVAVSTVAESVRRYSPYPPLSLYLFIVLGFYVFHLNGLRQGMALGFFLLALPQIAGGTGYRYVAWVLVAALFHTSALFALPLFPLFRMGYSVKTIIAVVALAVSFAFFSAEAFSLAGMISDRYARYGGRTETGAGLITLAYVLLAFASMFARSLVRQSDIIKYDRYLITFIFGVVVYATVFLTGSYVEISRLGLYFTASICFIIPMIYCSRIDRVHRSIVLILSLLLGAVYYGVYLSQIGGYVPYTTAYES